MLLVRSTHANMVNGALPGADAIPLPLSIAITLTMIGAFGPFLAAIILAARRGGRPGMRSLMRQFGRWRVRPVWYGIAFLGPALLGLIALCIDALSGRVTPARWFSLPRPVLLAGWAVGPWGEELGWRGYAQPMLQQRTGALAAAVCVGTVWSLWHYWPVFTPAGSLRELASSPFGIWLAYEIANSVIMAWLYNSTGGSLPIAWAAHVGLSLGQHLVNSHPIPFGSFVIVFCLAAIGLIFVYGPNALSSSSAEGPSPTRSYAS
jgi:membrane protease YdiL (CAAX protease family)